MDFTTLESSAARAKPTAMFTHLILHVFSGTIEDTREIFDGLSEVLPGLREVLLLVPVEETPTPGRSDLVEIQSARDEGTYTTIASFGRMHDTGQNAQHKQSVEKTLPRAN